MKLAIRLLKSPRARKIAASPQTRRLVVKAMQNDRIRKAVFKQVSKRLFSR